MPKSSTTSPLERTRAVISAWPETSEKLSHGSPTWWGGKKTFASFHDNHHGDERVALWVKAPLEMRDDLVATNPDGLFVPPYVGPAGWIGIQLDGSVPWIVVEDMLLRGYKMVAPKRALRALEEMG